MEKRKGMGRKMTEMGRVNIGWQEEIAAKRKFVSVWTAVVDGRLRLVKKICLGDSRKAELLAAKLREQVRLRADLPDIDVDRIVLYDFIQPGEGHVAVGREWREGTNLERVLADGRRFSAEEAVALTLETARILQRAHECNLFHGNLKPANVILKNGKDVSIVDWTTAELLAAIKDVLGEDTDGIGELGFETPEYLTVEQIQDGKPDQQCDIYALGVILHRLLTGESPFKKADAAFADGLAAWKQKHEVEDIRTQYPQLDIPSDLADLVADALKADRGQRLASLDEFVQRLESLGQYKVEEGTPATAGTSASSDRTGTFAPTGEMGVEHKLVLIGHTGAGKTVLMAGLYATQDKDFVVSDPGSRTQTGIHAINVKTMIENGEWPAATSFDDITHLKFKINRKGREETVCFDEYAGERLSREDYDREILGNPEGAFILLNPGAPQWQTPRERTCLISDIKRYIDVLSKKPSRPVIALVTTASDRLQSDLKAHAADFWTHVKQLENLLKLRGCTYKVFPVSVSGVLEDQKSPKLNPQNIKDPFIWFLKEMARREREKRIKTLLKVGLGVLIALAAACAGRWWWEGRQTVHLNSQYVDETEWEKYKPDSRPSFLFSSQRVKYEKAVKELEFRIDEAKFRKCEGLLNAALKEATPNNRRQASDALKELVFWRVENRPKKTELTKRYDKELPLAGEQYDTKELKRKFIAVLGKLEAKLRVFDKDSTVDALSEEVNLLKEEYGKWTELNSRLSREERAAHVEQMKKLNTDLERLWLDVRQSAERNIWKELEGRLCAFTESPGEKEALQKLRKECDERVMAKSVLSSEEHTAFKSRMSELCSKAEAAWKDAKKRIITDWFSDQMNNPVADVLRAYKVFILENRGNPHFALAETNIVELVEKEYLNKFKKRDYTERWYRDMKDLCLALGKTTSDGLKATKHYSFALKYLEWVDSKPWGVEVGNVQASSSYAEGAYVESIMAFVRTCGGNGDFVDTTEPRLLYQDSNGKKTFTSAKPLSEFRSWSTECHPWEFVVIRLDGIRQNIEWDLDPLLGDKAFAIDVGGSFHLDDDRKSPTGEFETITVGDVELKVYFKVTGKTFSDLVKEAYGE